MAVLLAVLAVSIPMSLSLLDRQRWSAAEALLQRVDTLLAGLSSMAADNLSPNLEGLRQLNAMRDQVASSMAEARYFTLTGYGLDDPRRFDYLWVSSDPLVSSKTDGRAFAAVNYGRVRLKDEIAVQVDGLAAEVNAVARVRVARMAQDADRLGAEAVALVRKGAASRSRLEELDREIFDLNRRIYFELQDIRGKARSFPPLNPRQSRELAASYLFYLPVVYRQRGEDVYFRGVVRLAVSTDRLRAELVSSQLRLLIQSALVAAAAFGLGLLLVFVVNGIGAAAPAARRPKGSRLTIRKERKA